jgi:hypothetical protein
LKRCSHKQQKLVPTELVTFLSHKVRLSTNFCSSCE